MRSGCGIESTFACNRFKDHTRSQEFEAAFAVVYREKFGDGLIVPANKTKLKGGCLLTPSSTYTMLKRVTCCNDFPRRNPQRQLEGPRVEIRHSTFSYRTEQLHATWRSLSVYHIQCESCGLEVSAEININAMLHPEGAVRNCR